MCVWHGTARHIQLSSEVKSSLVSASLELTLVWISRRWCHSLSSGPDGRTKPSSVSTETCQTSKQAAVQLACLWGYTWHRATLPINSQITGLNRNQHPINYIIVIWYFSGTIVVKSVYYYAFYLWCYKLLSCPKTQKNVFIWSKSLLYVPPPQFAHRCAPPCWHLTSHTILDLRTLISQLDLNSMFPGSCRFMELNLFQEFICFTSSNIQQIIHTFYNTKFARLEKKIHLSVFTNLWPWQHGRFIRSIH